MSVVQLSCCKADKAGCGLHVLLLKSVKDSVCRGNALRGDTSRAPKLVAKAKKCMADPATEDFQATLDPMGEEVVQAAFVC